MFSSDAPTTNPLSNALLGGPSSSPLGRGGSSDTLYSLRSGGSSPTQQGAAYEGGSTAPVSAGHRPMPPLIEDDSDDEFLMGFGGGGGSAAVNNNDRASHTSQNVSGRSISSGTSGNTATNSRRSAMPTGEEGRGGGGGANTSTNIGGSSSKLALLNQRSPSALDEFEELMAMGDVKCGTPALSPAGYKDGATAKPSFGGNGGESASRTHGSGSSPVVGSLACMTESSSSSSGGEDPSYYSSTSSSASTDTTEEGTESEGFDDYELASNASSSNSLGGNRWQNGGREAARDKLTYAGQYNNATSQRNAHRTAAGNEQQHLSNESMLLRLEMMSGRNSPRMGGAVVSSAGGGGVMMEEDEAEVRRREHLFGGSLSGVPSKHQLNSSTCSGGGAFGSSTKKKKHGKRSKSKKAQTTTNFNSSLSHFSFSNPNQRKPKRLKPMRVSKYLLGAVMGSGVTCTVRDAIDISNNNLVRVAVKLLKRPESKLSRLNPRDRAHIEGMIVNELEMLQRFHHPNVMRALDVFTRNAKEYVAMPIAVCSLQDFINIRAVEMQRRALEGCDSAFVSRTQSLNPAYQQQHQQLGVGVGVGSPLSSLPGGGGFDLQLGSRQQTSTSAFGGDDRFSSKVLVPAKLVKDIFLQVLAGVAYLHSQNVHHNDLKPSNILMFGDGTIKISDLGCSGPHFEVGRHGTPAFVSPQVVSHLIGHENPGLVSASEPIDPSKNDAWACGVVLYQLLTGRLPFGHVDDDDNDNESVDGGLYSGQRTMGGKVSADDLDLVGSDGRGIGGDSGARSRRPMYRRQVNEFTIYNDIVHLPVDYDRVFEEGDGGYESLRSPGGSVTNVPIPPPQALRGMGKGAASGKHLLMGLLNKNQKERLSVQAALQHPWLQDAVMRAPPVVTDYMPPIPNIDPTSQAPRAPGLAPQGSTAHNTSLKRLFDVAEIREMIEQDFRRHMQHVAEVCFIIRLELPPELYKTPCDSATKPPLVLPARPITPPSPTSCLYKCVKGDRFLPDAAMRYYAQKGRADCDVWTLRNQPQRRIHFLFYVEGLIHLCEELASKTTFLTTKGLNQSGAGGEGSSAKDTRSSSLAEASNGAHRGKSAEGATSNKNPPKRQSSAGDQPREEKTKSSCWCC